MQAKIAEWKKEKVKEIQRLASEYDVIGVVDMRGLPSLQLQKIKKKLKDKIRLVITRRRLQKIALESFSGKFDKLIPYLNGMCALLFSKEEPFMLFKVLKENKTKAPAKPGQIANSDLIVPRGVTPFPPGPIIGELGQIGIVASVEGGRVVINEDVVLVKEGEKIGNKEAEILSKLGIEPMEVGLNLMAVYSNGEVLSKDILDIDLDKYKSDLISCHNSAISLSVNIGYFCKENIKILINKCYNEARCLLEEVKDFKDAEKEKLRKGVREAEKLKEKIKSEKEVEVKIEEVEPEEVKEEKVKDIKKKLKLKKDEFYAKGPKGDVPKAEDLLKEKEKPEEKKEKIDVEKLIDKW